jgi:hypothetical protein
MKIKEILINEDDNAPVVTQAPTARYNTDGSVTVSWQTDVPSVGSVQVGDKMATDTKLATFHSVTVTGVDGSKPTPVTVSAVGANGGAPTTITAKPVPAKTNPSISNLPPGVPAPTKTPASTAPTKTPAPASTAPAPTSTALDNTPMANVAGLGNFKAGLSGTAQNPYAGVQYNLDDNNALTAKAGNGTQQFGLQHSFAPDFRGAINMNTNALGGRSQGFSFDKDLGKNNGTISFGAERGSDGEHRANVGYRLPFGEDMDTIKRNAGLL